jgi:hypothetical protein
MHCPNCGAEAPPDIKFCVSCGNPLGQAPPPGPAFTGAPPVPPKTPGGFFASTAGIVTIICVTLVIITAIVVVSIVATSGGSSTKQSTTKTKSSATTKADPVAEATAVMDRILPLYKTGGFSAVSGYMTSSYYNQFKAADPPWDQRSYTITDAQVTDHASFGDSAVTFTVNETLDDMGTPATKIENFELVKEGSTFKLNRVSEVVTTPSTEPQTGDETMIVKQAMLDWASAGLQPYEHATLEDFGWDNPSHTAASATVVVSGGDATATRTSVTAVLMADGSWSVSMPTGI